MNSHLAKSLLVYICLTDFLKPNIVFYILLNLVLFILGQHPVCQVYFESVFWELFIGQVIP